ncbi:MAG: aminotransferase class I/II-fold pyridoxal phosphate-dependent enzyme [Clostridia bacterium]|nr:aminotransferase class I/II-fold pyridoxal phosphate-dependent enzyme [Clostridia bacterium]
MKLADTLKTAGERQIPFHMPGHKRASFAHLVEIDYRMDFTETPDSDDLHHPDGVLLESQKALSELLGTVRSYYSVNGSTGCILSAIRASTLKGQKVLVARNCHKSVFNACELCGLETAYLLPEVSKEGIYLSVDPSALEDKLKREGDVALVVITSPTYEGVLSDVKRIGQICHRYGAVLMVDEAHGAHLGFYDENQPSAATLGADLVVQSYHKTLPSFTQTALLHLCSHRVDEDVLSAQMALFQSSSPSYLLLASLDGCASLLKENDEVFFRWREAVRCARATLKGLERLCLYDGEGAFAYDDSKLLILTHRAGITGERLYWMLYQRGIVCEMAGYNSVLAMTGAGDDASSLKTLCFALLEIDRDLQPKILESLPTPLPLPCQALALYACFGKKRVKTALLSAEGQICGEAVYLYPPGSPILLPGEVISKEAIDLIRRYMSAGIRVNGAADGILVLSEEQ